MCGHEANCPHSCSTICFALPYSKFISQCQKPSRILHFADLLLHVCEKILRMIVPRHRSQALFPDIVPGIVPRHCLLKTVRMVFVKTSSNLPATKILQNHPSIRYSCRFRLFYCTLCYCPVCGCEPGVTCLGGLPYSCGWTGVAGTQECHAHSHWDSHREGTQI